MGKNKNNNKFYHKKKQTVVTFDAEERKNYLRNMFGAKKRRR